MQLRELLNNQQILTPLISVKSNAKDESLQAFSDVFSDKTSDVRANKNTEIPNGHRFRADNLPNNEKDPANRFQVKAKVVEPKAFENHAESVKSAQVNREKDDAPIKKESSTQNDGDKELNEIDKSALKKIVKAKLKNITGLDDEALNDLLGKMTVELASLFVQMDEDVSVVSQLKDLMVDLELNDLLQTQVSEKNLMQVANQLDQLITAMNKLVETVENSEGKVSEEASPHLMQAIQALSRLSSKLKTSDGEEEITSKAIRTEIVKALVTPSQPIEADVKEANISADQVKTVALKLPSEAQIPIEHDNSSSKIPDDSPRQSTSIQPEVLANKTAQVAVEQQVEVDAESVEVKGVGLHQLFMKQGNSVVSQTIQTTPQLKQEVFSQLMDAIKGHIKLSDHGTAMIVKLQPEQLGNVELKLNLQKGIVLAEIKVENEIVKAAIESNLDDLKQSLNSKGYTIDQLSVHVDSGKKNRQETYQPQSRKNRNQQKDDEGSIEIIETVGRYLIDEYEGSTINYYG